MSELRREIPMISARVARSMLHAAAALCFAVGAAIAADSNSGSGWSDLESFYLRGDIGVSLGKLEGPDDEAVSLGLGVGHMWNDVLRSDLRLEWSGNYETTITDLDTTTLLANSYIDIPLDLIFTPYAGAGVGWGWIDVDGPGDDSGFAFSLMAGATFGLSDNIAIDTGYRFREIMLDGADFTDHSITAGALFKF
jgi:opacity protein-like surface antigen